MLKALRYLKPFWLSVIAIIVLVFGQVQCELALPDYMSNIVTYGVQYNGITDTSPRAMRASVFSHMELFMDENDKQAFEADYQRIETDDSRYINTYPILAAEPVYIRTTEDDISALTEKPFLFVSMLENSDVISQLGLSSSDEAFAMLEQNEEAREMFISSAEERLSSYTSSNLSAAESMLLKQEYTALGMNIEHLQSSYIIHEGGWMLLIAAIGSLCAIAAAFLSSRTATAACRNMRADVFAKVESFSTSEFSSFSTASLITRTTNDIQQIQQVMTMLLRIVLMAPMMGITSVLKVIRYRDMVWILGLAIILILAIMLITFKFTMPKFRLAQKLVDRLNLVTREQLSGMLVIRAFNNQKTEEKRFENVNKDITDVNIFVNRAMAVISPIVTFLMSGVTILIIWFGAKQVDLGSMQIGDMMAYLQYAMQVLISFMIVAMIFIMIPRSSVSAKRIFDVLETQPSIQDPAMAKHLPHGSFPVTFDHVSFRYPGAEEDVLHDITFTANPGETVAFIGSTGSGKSTLINLIPRFFDVSEGSIRFGNVDIRDVTQKELRQRIGYVPQKGVLFSGTVESNLKYADETAESLTIQNALAVSQSEEFVSRMPHQLQEPIAEGGTNVSGGQKQRLSIARALVRKADIYIFDDTFSALDYATEAKLRAQLTQMIEQTHATVFIVAQRISTIMHADKIIVLDQGRMAGIGTHEELMNNCRVYQEIAHSQLSRKELGEHE